MRSWDLSFLSDTQHAAHRAPKRALIILNQPFSQELLSIIWQSCQWHCCADGGANRLYDCLSEPERQSEFLPHLIQGDLDSIRPEIREYYESRAVKVIEDKDEYATDLMKCISSLQNKEKEEDNGQWEIILLGGLSGRLDQTVHILSYLHKLRKTRSSVFAVTDDNIGWVLDEGEHSILIDHAILGQTCGLLPVGVESSVITTKGLKWNLEHTTSSFEGLVSTSNHLLPEELVVSVETSRPIWWCAELRREHFVSMYKKLEKN